MVCPIQPKCIPELINSFLVVFCGGSSRMTATMVILDARVPIFEMFHPSPNTAGTHAHISVCTLKSEMNFSSRFFFFNKEFNDSTLLKRTIVVDHFANIVCGHIIEVNDVTGNPRRKKGVGPHLQESVADINLQHCKSISVTGVSRVVQCDTGTCTIDEGLAQRKANIRKNSFSLLDPEGATIPSLVDLSQRDYDVNAPVSSGLLQGQDLLKALETSSNALMD
ncbi:hypothetical protein ANN_03068 [Periplaneta americana]|uniref:Uncharacterized protein n=1 Tax=Periplaneta americana TaxID=6978 RepID=A0ABQ8TY05_PERAM|nr:hypothetical protein ANN_03068 [Periplaneta americana]